MLKLLDLFDDYTKEYVGEATKLQTLFANNADAAFLHKGVTEKLGTSVEAFASMIAFVQDILGSAQGDVPEVCFTFAAALEDARDASAQHVAIIHPSQPFQSFFQDIFPSYVRAICGDSDYYLSDLELKLLCLCRKVSVVIVMHNLDEDSMKYSSHAHAVGQAESVWVAIQARTGEQRVRSHFERLQLVEVEPSGEQSNGEADVDGCDIVKNLEMAKASPRDCLDGSYEVTTTKPVSYTHLTLPTKQAV